MLAALDGRELQPHEARELHARTEGWPAAVYLAARRAHRVRGGGPAAAVRVSGRDTDIGDYLDAELLDHATPRVRDLPAPDRGARPHVAGPVRRRRRRDGLRPDPARPRLDQPARRALDTHGGWFRYHTLLREHLLAKLERDRGAAERVHRRAAEWFAATGQPEAAVDHLFAAGDADAAAAQACDVIPRLFREGREVTVARWLQRLDDAQLRRQPFLAAMGAWMHTIQGRVAEAEHFVDVTAGAEYAGDRPPGAGAYAEARASVRALHARDGLDAAIRDAREAAEQSDRFSAWRPQTLAVLGAILTVAGRPDEGEQCLADAASSAQALGRRAGAAVRGLVARAGRDRARRLDDRRLAVAADDRGRVADALRPGRDRRRPLGRDRARRGASLRAGEARRQMATFQVARAALGPATSWVSVRCLIEAARVHLALADPAGARSCLQQASDVLVRRPDLGPLGRQAAELRERIRTLPPGPGGTSTLTPAEVRVLRLLPTYLTAAEMAERLFVTPNTVRTQIQALYGKLAATSRAEAVEAAIEIGLLEPLPVLAPGRITSI